MTRHGRWYLSALLWTWGGAVYFLAEVVYKLIAGKPEQISWTMLVLAAILCIPIERLGGRVPYPLLAQGFACAVLITFAELVAGLVLNVWLGLGVWDYSAQPCNLLGQICLPFSLLWWLLATVFIPVFDHVRSQIEGQ